MATPTSFSSRCVLQKQSSHTLCNTLCRSSLSASQAQLLTFLRRCMLLQEVFLTSHHLGIAMEYADGGDLSQYIDDQSQQGVRIVFCHLHGIEIACLIFCVISKLRIPCSPAACFGVWVSMFAHLCSSW